MTKLTRAFYERNALIVAREILGKGLVHNSSDGFTAGQIIETEAYIGPNDRASHAYLGLRTKRTNIQFGLGGYAYIYQIYGKYCCFNIVVAKVEKPEVVLIRALRPIEGFELMAKRHGFFDMNLKRVKRLTDGPGKLCIAMGITKEHYGEDLCGDTIFVTDNNTTLTDEQIDQTPRINIDYAEEASKYPWRFVIKEKYL